MTKDPNTAKIERLKALLLEYTSVGETELAHAVLDELLELCGDQPVELPTPKIPNWNTTPEWEAFLKASRMETEIKKIANKYTTDEGLREDCEQEAREAVYQIHPEQLREFVKYQAGEMDEVSWKKRLKSYCANAARNAILSYLESPKTGNWYIGRTRRVRDRETGERRKIHVGPRYSSLDELVSEAGLQIDEAGKVSWEKPSDDGLSPIDMFEANISANKARKRK
jgi:hypothetical protein